MEFRYLFGTPVGKCRPVVRGCRTVFLLGAYPSTAHVRWKFPDGSTAINAVAVDDEPEPFWNGIDEAARVARWAARVGFQSSWGTAEPCGRFNGSSGVWVDTQVLSPLGVERSAVWKTDCLQAYRESKRAAETLAHAD